jgi:hypothetical protein
MRILSCFERSWVITLNLDQDLLPRTLGSDATAPAPYHLGGLPLAVGCLFQGFETEICRRSVTSIALISYLIWLEVVRLRGFSEASHPALLMAWVGGCVHDNSYPCDARRDRIRRHRCHVGFAGLEGGPQMRR